MQQISGRGSLKDGSARTPDLKDLALTAISTLRRRMMSIMVLGAAMMAIAAVVILSGQNHYMATTMLLLDPRPRQLIQDDAGAALPAFLDQGAIQAEIDILGTDSLARQVVTDLHLTDDETFARPRDAPPTSKERLKTVVRQSLDWMIFAFGFGTAVEPDAGSHPSPDELRFQQVVETYRERLRINGGSKSFTVTLGFTHQDPEMAARIVNAHAATYLEEQRAFKEEIGSATATWLQQMLTELGPKLAAAEVAAEAARSSIGRVGRDAHEITVQQVTELNRYLIQARGERTAKEARVRQTEEALRSRQGVEAISQVISSPVIVDFKGRLAGLAREEAQLLVQYGPKHPAVISIRGQVRDLEQQVQLETSRIVRSIRNDAEIAKAEEDALQEALDKLQARSVEQDAASVQVGALEREATAIRTVFESMLGRFKQLEAQRGQQRADARIVSEASVPRNPTFPSKTILLMMSVLLSLLIAVALVCIQEWFRSGYRSLREVEEDIGIGALWMVPKLDLRERRKLHDCVVSEPASLSAESVRAMRRGVEALCRSNLPKVILVTSCLPGEGKSTLAIALARSLAGTRGRRVMLLDCDLRRPAVARLIGGESDARGVPEICEDPSLLSDAVQADRWSDLCFIAGGRSSRGSGDVIASSEFDQMISTLRIGCDWIVIDSPPLAAVSDALALMRVASAVVVVIRYARTPRSLVKACLRRMMGDNTPPLAVALNQVELKRMTNFTPSDPEYYHHLLRRYYR
jgi:capsular exopolysaccharide synthesis family protein